MMTSAEIRRAFLEFFRSKQHEIIPSASIVVKNDPSLLFTNAGMNPFKDYFLGNKPAPFPRVADTQKCLRVSGKHNDLEEVGVDTYHHTMFEMLGNWSFGDYFKKEAIAWSWELLTEVYRIPKDRLYVTVFKGDVPENMPADEEAIMEWKKWIAEDRIIGAGKKENFWEMGDTGPCGPCTEIHVDCRPDAEREQAEGKHLVNADHPQVIEIWNNVFIQFNRLKDGSLEQLPSRHVDTGMGLERLVRVLQQKQSNYDTDIFAGIISETEKITHTHYDYGNNRPAVAFRVIADHLRAIAFTIADGQLPSNTGAGYVIRRVLRRAVRYYYSYLDYKQPLLFQLIPLLAEQFRDVFPELMMQYEFVEKVVREEENNFLRTINTGLQRFDAYVSADESVNAQPENNPDQKEKIISGAFAFELNDTFGFPIDLTQLMAAEKGFTVDMAAFEKEMQQQKNRSRTAGATDMQDWIVVNENAQTKFAGYDSLETETCVVKYRKATIKGKEVFQVVLEATPFYAESGGQVGDTGKLVFPGGEVLVTDTKKENDLIIHFAGSIPEVTGEVLAKVDTTKRKRTAIHHSATHLLHAALRQVLGTHVAQKGSLVNEEQLRFDFSHFAKVTDEEITRIEALVNEKIRQNIPVVIRLMPKEEAIAEGAMALFGEKYGDTVRVVVIDPQYSIELCGGTHVGATGELGYFKIRHESAVAAGVRRIEALSGQAAENFINEQLQQLGQIKQIFKNPKELTRSVEKFVESKNEVEKRLEKIESAKSQEIIQSILQNNVTDFAAIKVVAAVFEAYSEEMVNHVYGNLRSKVKDSVIIIGATVAGNHSLRFLINTKNANYSGIVSKAWLDDVIAPELQEGSAGGNDFMLNATGKFKSGVKNVVERIAAYSVQQIEEKQKVEKFWES